MDRRLRQISAHDSGSDQLTSIFFVDILRSIHGAPCIGRNDSVSFIGSKKLINDADQFPSLSSLLRQALGDLISPDATSFLDMCDENIVFEFPYAPEGTTERLAGKSALEAYLPTVAELLTIQSMSLSRVIVAAGSDAATIEFSCKGYSNETGARYDQVYVSVVDLKGGFITRYRDYWNPLVLLPALKSSPATKGAR